MSEVNSIKSYVNNVLLDLGIEEHLIKDEHYVRDNIGLDSTEVVEVALAIKKKFNIELSLKNDMKLSEIYSYIACK